MPKGLLTGFSDRPSTALIYEPKQRSDKPHEPVEELDRVDLETGQSVEYEFPTATAAFTLIEREADAPPPGTAGPLNPAPTPDQEANPSNVLPETQSELDAGRARHEQANPQRPAAEPVVGTGAPEADAGSPATPEEKTAGQAPEAAANPSPATGTTGQESVNEEVGAGERAAELETEEAPPEEPPPEEPPPEPDVPPEEPEAPPPKKGRKSKS